MLVAASTAGALHFLFVLIVVGIVIAAAVAAWRGLWVACACLVVVAIVAAYLLI